MANRDIAFSEFALSEAKLINQALQVTLKRASEKPTIFYAYGYREDGKPTQLEVEHAKQILGYAIDYQVIPYGADQHVADALNFVAWDIETWVSGRDTSQSEGDAIHEYSSIFGIDATRATTIKLRYMARRICPRAEIHTDCTVTVLSCDKHLAGCAKALEKLLAPAPLGTLEYNAYLGIVVDGVIYNIPRIHPVAGKLLKAIEEYQDHTYQEGEWLENKATGSSR